MGYLNRNEWRDLHIVDCRPKVLDCDTGLSSIAQISCVVVDPQFT